MTPTEIRNLIAKKIEGQGSAIDIGNGLPAILNGLIELVENAVPAALKNIPVIEKITESPVSISEELYSEIVINSAIIYDGKLMTLVTDETIARAVLEQVPGSVVTYGQVEYDERGDLNSYHVIYVASKVDTNSYWLGEIDY